MKVFFKKSFLYFFVFVFIFSQIHFFIPPEQASAAVDASQLEYSISIGPVSGNTGSGYVYASIFNPSGSNKTASINRIRIGADAAGAANYVNITIRRISSASGGTQITADNIPQHNASSSPSVLEVRYGGPGVGYPTGVNSRINSVNGPGAAGAYIGKDELVFSDNEKLILKPGEGVALYQEAAGNANFRIRLSASWEETASTPASGGEYIISYPRVENAAAADYKYATFFNPSASGKTAIVKRISIDVDADTTATYANAIYLRRISTASGGTQISVSDVPKKNSETGDTAMELRHTGVTATLLGTIDSKLMQVTPPAVASQPHAHMELLFDSGDEPLIIKPGEGIALVSSATGDVDQLVRLSLVWEEVSTPPASQGEYLLSIGPVTGSITSGYTYISFFNPSASGKTVVVKRLAIRNDTNGAGAYQATTIRRINSASGGTQITAANIPKKNSSSTDSIAEVRYASPTVGLLGTADSRIFHTIGPGAVAQIIGHREILFGDEKLILKPGEGFAFYQEAAGTAAQLIKLLVEWDEEASAPSSQAEYITDIGIVNGSTAANYNYISFFNPSASGKTILISKILVRVNAVAAATYIPMRVRRTSSASGGTQITAANIPKKHTSSTDSIADIRRTGPTVGLSGVVEESDFIKIITPGAVPASATPQISGHEDHEFVGLEKFVLKPGEGIALYHSQAADADERVRLLVEWKEQNTTPDPGGEYISTIGPITSATDTGYVYASFFNPVASGKNYLLRRIYMRVDGAGTISPGYFRATVRKTTDASGGTSYSAANIPEKHSSTTNTTAEIRHTNPSVTFDGSSDSRIISRITPGASGQANGAIEIFFDLGDEFVLKPGEGIALYQEDAGSLNLRFQMKVAWLESNVPTVVTVGTTGTQTASMDVSSANNYVGGAFLFSTNLGSVSVTQIKISEKGTVNAQTNLSNLKLFYKQEGSCSASIPGDASVFNAVGVGFNSSQEATATGSMAVGTSQVCVYAQLDVGSGAGNGETIEIEISNPSTDVLVSSGSVSPASSVQIAGTTNLIALSIMLTLSTSTINLGNFTPGFVVTATSSASVSVTSPTGWNLQTKRNDANSTLDLTTDAAVDFPDATAWDPTASAGSGNAATSPGTNFSFRVKQTGTDAALYNSTWWGANDTGGVAKYAGFPSASAKVSEVGSYVGSSQVVVYETRADSPATQKSGSYDGTITMTALANP